MTDRERERERNTDKTLNNKFSLQVEMIPANYSCEETGYL